MTWQQVYWITRLDAINGLFRAMAILSFIAAMVFFCAGRIIRDCWSSEDEIIKRARTSAAIWMRRMIPVSIAALIFTVLTVLLPTTKEATAIYIIPKVMNNEQVQNIGDKGLKLLEAKFDEWLKDTAGEEKGDK